MVPRTDPEMHALNLDVVWVSGPPVHPQTRVREGCTTHPLRFQAFPQVERYPVVD